MTDNRTTEFIDEPDAVRNELMDEGLLMTDNRTTELLRKLLDERGVEYVKIGKRLTYWSHDGQLREPDDADYVADIHDGRLAIDGITPEQAIAATLGGGKLTAKQVREAIEKHWHDLSADYDMPEATALPEYSYDWQAIADELNAELGGGNCARCAEDMGRYADSLCDPLKERIAELLRCLENDWHIRASWDGLRKFWCIELTEEGVKLRDAARAERTCKCVAENAKSPLDGKTIVLHRCSECHELMRHFMHYCPNCGARVVA